MKKLFILLLLVSLSNIILSQKINEDYILPDQGNYYVSIYLNIEGLKMSKSDSVFDDIDSLKTNDYKELKDGFTFFAFKKTYMSVWYNTPNKSLVGNLKSINVLDNNIVIGMNDKRGNFISIEISKNQNGYTTIIKETNKKGKVKVYFSEDCELNRYSI